ncbi:MAG TPA: PKD domain-containing protein [Flavipsychrobacter sp.]|nr:PKD domain-containing protein [Flavipsychrobacter sp.]
MNNGKSIFTRTKANIDTRVWLTLIITTILSTGLLAYKIADNVHCVPFDIVVKGYTAGKEKSFYLGNSIHFTTTFVGKGEIVWDFGDKGKATGAAVSHAYQHEGTFIVSATVSGKCVETYKLSVVRLEQIKSANSVSMDNPISGPEVIYTGDPASFTSALAADRYEWSVLNSPEFPVQTSASATFSFPVAGTRIIELRLDGDASKIYRKNIQVLPQQKTAEALPMPTGSDPLPPVLPPPSHAQEELAEEKEPAKPKVMIIPNEEFRNLFEAATSGSKDVQSITQYLCNGDKTKVLLNGTEWETVGSFMQKIYNKKKFDIKSVEAVRDESNCVTILKIKYKKRLL